jgi:3-hydroxybutyryl-CoA dehydratase
MKSIKQKGLTIDEIQVGDSAVMTTELAEDKVIGFARISGDDNPVHFDEVYAKSSVFGKRIVHGMLVASQFSEILGTVLPGYGCIYMSQDLKFLAPVYIGDKVIAECIVTEVNKARRKVTLSTVCTKEDGTLVIEGTAIVRPRE